MQPLTATIRRRFTGQESAGARQIAVGVAVFLLLAVVAATAGILYVRPPGHRTVVFAIADAAAVKPGTVVRVAGLSVGKVEAVRLGKDSVRVEASIDDNIYLGDRTSVDVRMLTAAGGYYIAMTSAGSTPLGDAIIPVTRARPPYTLPDVLADTAEKLQQIDAGQLGATLDRLASGLEANPASISTIVDGVSTIAQIVNHQQDQLRTALDATTELVHTSAANQSLLLDIMRKSATFAATLDTFKVGVLQTIVGLAKVVDAVNTGVEFYDSHRDWLLGNLRRTDNALNVINTDIPRIIWNLGRFIDNLRNFITPGDRQLIPTSELLATDICVPMQGRTC